MNEKYNDINATTIYDELSKPTEIKFEYKPRTGGGSTIPITLHNEEEAELLDPFVRIYVTLNGILRNVKIEDITIDEEKKPSARKSVKQLRDQAYNYRNLGVEPKIVDLILDIAQDIENKSK